MKCQIVPAILTNSVTDLQYKIRQVSGLTEWIQIDIMDGIYVPDRSVAVTDVASITGPFRLSAHLMVDQPELYFPDCQDSGFRQVIFHYGATDDPSAVLDAMQHYTFEKGLALNPEEEIDDIVPLLNRLQVVLLMSVHPGAQGRHYISPVAKIKKLKVMAPEKTIIVDGGINQDTVTEVAAAGAHYVVVGSAIFRSEDIGGTIRELQRECALD